MESAKKALFVITLALLTAGYAASQLAWWDRTFAEYAKRVDTPPVQHAAMILLLAVVLSAVFWNKPNQKEADG